MARLSKTHNFKIWEDSGIPTPPTDENDPFEKTRSPRASNKEDNRPSFSSDEVDFEVQPRDSLTSVSTFPDSASQHDDTDVAPEPPSPERTPQIIRPSFRRPESVKRMQMSSPRQSVRSECGRGTPRGRRRITEESVSEASEAGQRERREHPLVLLHITLLPVEMPWSGESMEELLPTGLLERLELLRSKVSEMVSQRGVLIPHPREEYEMLEEYLLEALELKPERVTKSGHFIGSVVTDSRRGSCALNSDSGLGSSADGSDNGDLCATCQHHMHAHPSRKQHWSIKVFAANGLMRSSAWAAAWSEMESVDVEILPWISADDRRKLDRRKEEEAVEEKMRLSIEQAAIREARWEETLPPERRESESPLRIQSNEGNQSDRSFTSIAQDANLPDQQPHEPTPESAPDHELPNIYRPAQIPISHLLRNYVALLAEDRRNVTTFFLSMLVLLLAVGLMLPKGTARPSITPAPVAPLSDTFTVVGDSGLMPSVALEPVDGLELPVAQSEGHPVPKSAVPNASHEEPGVDKPAASEERQVYSAPSEWEHNAESEKAAPQSEELETVDEQADSDKPTSRDDHPDDSTPSPWSVKAKDESADLQPGVSGLIDTLSGAVDEPILITEDGAE